MRMMKHTDEDLTGRAVAIVTAALQTEEDQDEYNGHVAGLLIDLRSGAEMASVTAIIGRICGQAMAALAAMQGITADQMMQDVAMQIALNAAKEPGS